MTFSTTKGPVVMASPVQTTLKCHHHSPPIPTVMPSQDAGVVMDMYSYAMKTVQHIPDERKRMVLKPLSHLAFTVSPHAS